MATYTLCKTREDILADGYKGIRNIDKFLQRYKLPIIIRESIYQKRHMTVADCVASGGDYLHWLEMVGLDDQGDPINLINFNL